MPSARAVVCVAVNEKVQFAPVTEVVNAWRVFAYAKFLIIPPATVPEEMVTVDEDEFSAPIVFYKGAPWSIV